MPYVQEFHISSISYVNRKCRILFRTRHKQKGFVSAIKFTYIPTQSTPDHFSPGVQRPILKPCHSSQIVGVNVRKSQWYKTYPKKKNPKKTQNSKRQTDDMKQIPYCGPSHIRRHPTDSQATWRTAFVHPLIKVHIHPASY